MVEILPDYLWRSLIAGIGVASMTGPLGALIVWQRMSYFGDALAHASLLGVAISIFFAINITLGVIVTACLMSLILVTLQSCIRVANDTLLGVLSQTSLALGLMAFSILPGPRVDMMSYLYGDILAVTWQDVRMILCGGFFIFCILIWIWAKMLHYIIHPDLAFVEGVNIKTLRWIFITLIAFVVAVGIKIVGVLLLTALLIIPAATASCRAKSPEGLAFGASALGIFAVLGGLIVSQKIDLPTGPAIVVMLAFFFVIGILLKKAN